VLLLLAAIPEGKRIGREKKGRGSDLRGKKGGIIIIIIIMKIKNKAGVFATRHIMQGST